jgi:hypothetical protein
MSPNSSDGSLSSRVSSKNNFRPCPTCPHRLSDFWKHEATPKPESGPEAESEDVEEQTNKGTAKEPRTAEAMESSSQAQVSSNAQTRTGLTPHQTCPGNCTCPNVAAKVEEHVKTPEAKSYLDTKEGQDHIRICILSCPYRKLQAERDAVAKKDADAKTQKWYQDAVVEDARKHRVVHEQKAYDATLDIDTETGLKRLRICVPTCPHRLESGGPVSDKSVIGIPVNEAWKVVLKTGLGSVVGEVEDDEADNGDDDSEAVSKVVGLEGEGMVSEC